MAGGMFETVSDVQAQTRMDILEKLSGRIRFRLTNAYMFVAVFQKNEEALCSLIAALLHIPRESIVSLEIRNPIKLGEDIGKKSCVLDLLILMNGDMKIHLEMQVENEGNWDDRGLYYLAQNILDLKAGEDYHDLQKTVQIGILDFNFPKDNTEFYQEVVFMNTKTHRIFSDKAVIRMLCLTQIKNASQEDHESGLVRWARFFKAETWEELKHISEGSEVMRKTIVTLAQLSEDEKIREHCRLMDKYEHEIASAKGNAMRQGLEQGLTQGLEQGLAQGLELNCT